MSVYIYTHTRVDVCVADICALSPHNICGGKLLAHAHLPTGAVLGHTCLQHGMGMGMGTGMGMGMAPQGWWGLQGPQEP